MKNIDPALVRQAQAGDGDSFAALYEQLAPSLYRTALYLLGDPHDAQDAVAETFLEAYNGLGGLRQPESFAPWMQRILSVRCKRKIRGYVAGRKTVDLEELQDLDDGSDLSAEASQRSDLRQALAKLSPAERELVLLCAVEGYTTKEAAQILRCPHGTVSSKLFRALRKLRKDLEG